MSGESKQKPRKERKENADRRRRQLLDAARHSILRHGLARTTLATVAEEAGLSQGVAVFYFKSKGGLLTETLRDLYQSYEALWVNALEDAGADPRKRLEAIVEADFDTRACGPEVLPLWFAFWGEVHFQSQYDEVAKAFEARRRAALDVLWQELLGSGDGGEAGQLAEWMETLTDGYWQRLHLSAGSFDRETARKATRIALALMRPEVMSD